MTVAKDYYHEILIPEVARYAVVRDMDPEQLDEYGAAIYATWYSIDPIGLGSRDKLCNFEEEREPIVYDRSTEREAFGEPRLGPSPMPTPAKRKKKHGVYFTAHKHPDEPLIPSPDDYIVYARLRLVYSRTDSAVGPLGKADMIHFIIDHYTCRRALDTDDD